MTTTSNNTISEDLVKTCLTVVKRLADSSPVELQVQLSRARQCGVTAEDAAALQVEASVAAIEQAWLEVKRTLESMS